MNRHRDRFGGVPWHGPAGDAAVEDLWDAEVMALARDQEQHLAGYLRSAGCDRGLVDNVVHDSFVAARRRWGEVRRLDNPLVHVYRVAIHRMRRLQRAQHAEPGYDLAGMSGDTDPQAAGTRVSPPFDGCFVLLPRRQLEVFLLHHIYEFTISEVGAILTVSERTVRKYLFLAQRKLMQWADLIASDLEGGQEGQ